MVSVLVFGKQGQLATALAVLGSREGAAITCLGRGEIDILDAAAIGDAIVAHRADMVVNASAYTAVDKAESDVDAAMALNEKAPGLMARACDKAHIPFVHVSTDYVFDGAKPSAYVEDDATGPLSVYGKSKLAGEKAVTAACERYIILRTSWVFSAWGANFVRTVLRLSHANDRLRIVVDQHGGPTAAEDLASAMLAITGRLSGEIWGIYHFSGAPVTTWFGFAEEVFQQSSWWMKIPVLEPIPTSAYPTPARRPLNSELDCSKIARVLGMSQPDWRLSLRSVLASLRENEA